MSYWILLFHVFLSGFSPILTHDIHLSVCEIYKSAENIEVTIKVFYDDLQSAMGLVPGEVLPKEYSTAEELIEKYINENFALYLNNQRQVLVLEETTAALPAVWTTFNIKMSSCKSNKCTLKVYNNILIEQFRDQQNLVKLYWDKIKQTHQMDKKATYLEINIAE